MSCMHCQDLVVVRQQSRLTISLNDGMVGLEGGTVVQPECSVESIYMYRDRRAYRSLVRYMHWQHNVQYN